MLELTKGKIAKEIKKYAVRFTPKYKALNILQNNIEVVVKKSTQIWKLIYGLTIVKQGEVDPLEGKHDDKDDEKNDDKDDDKDNTIGGETKMKEDDKATTEKKKMNRVYRTHNYRVSVLPMT